MSGFKFSVFCFAFSSNLGYYQLYFLIVIVTTMIMAEREGFEPPEPFGSMVFKTTAIDHSAISPDSKKLTARDNEETCKQFI